MSLTNVLLIDLQLPAWPFVSLSFGVGVFALGPFFALWTPSKEAKSPPAPEELKGWRNFGLKGTETKLGGWLIAAGALFLVGQVKLDCLMSSSIVCSHLGCSLYIVHIMSLRVVMPAEGLVLQQSLVALHPALSSLTAVLEAGDLISLHLRICRSTEHACLLAHIISFAIISLAMVALGAGCACGGPSLDRVPSAGWREPLCACDVSRLCSALPVCAFLDVERC